MEHMWVQGPNFGIFFGILHKKRFENLFIMTIDFPENRAMGTIVGPPIIPHPGAFVNSKIAQSFI
jgi:hypothetical protein